jgi:CRP-like cAMP-binding protein
LLKSVLKFFSDPVFAKKKEFLKSLSLFQDLDNRDLGYVLQALHSRIYEAGEPLFLEDDIGRALFILESGRVEVTKRDAKGQQQRLALIEPGEFFGEMALLEHLPRSASAVAAEKSQIHLLYRTRLESLLYYHPRIGVSILRHLAMLLSARLRKATSLISQEGLGIDL